MSNQPPRGPPQQPPTLLLLLLPQQGVPPQTPTGGAPQGHPRSNYSNSSSSAPNSNANRHHYNNNSSNGNKPYRKSFSKENQYQQGPLQYPPYYPPVMYGYQQPMYYAVSPYDQYGANTGYYQQPLMYHPDQHQGHKPTLTDKAGNKIQLKKPAHSRLPSTATSTISQASSVPASVASESEPATLPATPLQPPKTPASVPATISSPAKPALTDSQKKAQVEEFKAKIAARAAALQKLKEEKAKAAAATSSATPEPLLAPELKKEEVVEKVLEPVKSEPEVKKEEPIKEVEKVELEPVETAKEEATEPEKKTVEPPVETEKPAVEEAEKVAEEPVVETEEKKESPEVEEEQPQAVSEEKLDEPSTVDTIPEEKLEAEVPSFTISKLFNLLRFARPVNPYTNTYPSTITPPNPKLSGGSKIKYDPVFLVQFQQPLNLPRDDEWDAKYGAKIVIPNVRPGAAKGNDRSFSRNSSSQFGKGFIGGGPVQMRSQTNLRGGDFNSRSGSRQGSKRKPKEKSSRNKGSRRDKDRTQEEDEDHKPTEPAEPVKPLEKSANRWVPRSRGKPLEEVKTAPDGTVLLGEEDIQRKTKSLLNKLTLELFDVITNDIIAIANQSKYEEDGKTLKTVIELTFAKACDEPHWSNVYAKLCVKLCATISSDVKDNTLIDANTGNATSGSSLIRKYLLTRCQIEYEKGWTDKLPTNPDGSPLEPEMMSDEYYQLAAAKRRGLGLVRFIGELFSLGLLSEKIIVRCISGLVANVDDPSEDMLENLVQLLNTVGPLIDASANQNFVNFLDGVFGRIDTIINTCKMSSRMKFKLMDLSDLRKKRWRGKEGDKGPKTLNEIHDEAERKRYEEERLQNERRQNSRRGDSRSNSTRGGSNNNLASQWGSSNRVSQNDIKSVGTIRNSDRHGPMNNFREKSSRGNNDSSSFASNSRAASSSNLRSSQNSSASSTSLMGQAQSPGPSSPSPMGLNTRENSKREPANRFAALEDHDDDNDVSESEEEETTNADSESTLVKDESEVAPEDVSESKE